MDTDDKATPDDSSSSSDLADLDIRLLRKDVAFWIDQSDTWKNLASAERDRADRAEARIAQAVDWDDYRDAHAFGDMGTPYVNGARHAHAAISRILREATA